MMTRIAMLVGGAAVAAAGLTTRQAEADGGAPSGTRGLRSLRHEWLAPAIRVGRNELQIARFQSAQASPQALLDDITAEWARRPAPIQRSAEGGWLIAIQADGEWVETVRVRADEEGAAGLKIRQRLTPRPTAGLQLERLLPQARIVNRTDQDGAGRAITTWVLVSRSAPAHLLAVARTEARRDGYVEDIAGIAGSGPLWLRRRAEEVVISATAGADGTVAVVHWSRKP